MSRKLIDLLRSRPSPADCEHCLSQLDAYVTAQLNGEPAATLFAAASGHLDLCLTCAQAYALLYETQLAEATETMVDPAVIPQPDLSFLQTKGVETAPSLTDQLRHTLHISVEQVRLQLTAVLLPYLQPLPQTASVRLAANNRYQAILLCLTPEHVPETMLPFTLMAYQDLQNERLCLIEVIVEPPGVSWPDLGGRQVTLRYGEAVRKQTTDDWGTAVFPDVPVADLETVQVIIDL